MSEPENGINERLFRRKRTVPMSTTQYWLPKRKRSTRIVPSARETKGDMKMPEYNTGFDGSVLEKNKVCERERVCVRKIRVCVRGKNNRVSNFDQ